MESRLPKKPELRLRQRLRLRLRLRHDLSEEADAN